MRLASKIHHPEADKIVALLIGSEYIQPWHPCWYGLLSYIWQANAALYTNKENDDDCK